MPDIDDPFLEELEPVATQQGIDVPGSRSGFSDFINFGVFNGNFRVGPPQAASNIDVAASLTGSNFLPGWRFVQSSNARIDAKIVGGTTANAGSNIRFTVNSTTSSGDSAFIEQIIDLGGSASGDLGQFFRLTGQSTVSSLRVDARTQYLAADGSIVDMPAEASTTATMLSGTVNTVDFNSGVVNPVPANARYMRLRLIATAPVGPVTAGQYLDIFDVRRDRGPAVLRMPDSSRSTNGIYDVFNSGSNLLWQPSSTTAGSTTTKRLLNYQLVPIPFTLNSIPASATTDLQPFDNAVAQGTPRISVGWAGSIVGLSYRLTGAPTAGGASALVIWATVAGAQTWKAFTIPGTGGNAADQTTQAPKLSTFTSSQGLGIQVVTSGTYAPTTRNISAILWIAVEYDGT